MSIHDLIFKIIIALYLHNQLIDISHHSTVGRTYL